MNGDIWSLRFYDAVTCVRSNDLYNAFGNCSYWAQDIEFVLVCLVAVASLSGDTEWRCFRWCLNHATTFTLFIPCGGLFTSIASTIIVKLPIISFYTFSFIDNKAGNSGIWHLL